MDERAVQEKITVYRNSRDEWMRRRQVALAQADEYLAKVNGCVGAIEALETLIAKPIENVIGGEVVDLPR